MKSWRKLPGACARNARISFSRGHTFSYRLEVLGAYYRDYLDLMRHWDAVLPRRVLRMQYESLGDR